MMKVNNWLKSARLRLWPQCCQLCGEGPLATDNVLCQACQADLPWNRVCCQVCALPLAYEATCGRCLRKPPPYHHALATFSYKEPLSHIVHGLKFGQRLYYGRFLGDALAQTVSQDERLIIPDLIIPVPLHRKRLNERGYNQAYEIARPTAKLLQCPVTDRFVVRSSETKQQSQLNALQRRRNLKNVFIVLGAVKGLHVAIVDDVMTTGATVGELTRALIQAGARRIDIWLAARAPLGGN